jgi:hypothetical protein
MNKLYYIFIFTFFSTFNAINCSEKTVFNVVCFGPDRVAKGIGFRPIKRQVDLGCFSPKRQAEIAASIELSQARKAQRAAARKSSTSDTSPTIRPVTFSPTSPTIRPVPFSPTSRFSPTSPLADLVPCMRITTSPVSPTAPAPAPRWTKDSGVPRGPFDFDPTETVVMSTDKYGCLVLKVVPK